MNYMEEEKIEKILKGLPGSYDDFVDSTIRRMQENEDLQNIVMEFLQIQPQSRPSDVLKVVCNYFGACKPLELVDDEDEGEEIVVSAPDTAGVMMRVS